MMREQTIRDRRREAAARRRGAGGYNPETQQGGIRPIPFGPMTTTAIRDGRTEDGALQIWLTPHGFLKGAAANAATLTAGPRSQRIARAFVQGVQQVHGHGHAQSRQPRRARTDDRCASALRRHDPGGAFIPATATWPASRSRHGSCSVRAGSRSSTSR